VAAASGCFASAPCRRGRWQIRAPYRRPPKKPPARRPDPRAPPGARPNAAAPPRHSSNLYMKVSFYMKENRTSIQAEFHPEVILSLSFILVLALLLPLKLPGSTASHPTRQCWFSKSGRANKLLALRLNIQLLYLGNCKCFSGLVATTFFLLPCSIAVSP